MRNAWRYGRLGMLLAALTACGGGGGGGESTYRLSFSPSTLTASFAQGAAVAPLVVTASLDRTPDQTVNVAVIDTVGVIEPSLQLVPLSNTSYQATLTPKNTLPVGEHTGSLQVRLCFDHPGTCASPLPGSPYTLPYRFTVSPPPALHVSPARVAFSADEDEAPVLPFSVSTPSGTAFVQFVDKGGVFQFDSEWVTVGASLNRTLPLNPRLAPGTYNGQIELRVCKVLPCTQELPGSPVVVPYAFTLRPSINLSAISAMPGAAEWAQHQANAAHTGYVPVTLDATKFTRRWRWSPPLPDGASTSSAAGNLYPVVTSRGAVYAVTEGRFQAASVYALSEHDRSLRWKKDFGSIYAANPPSTDAGNVYLATSGHQDTYMWGFNGTDGTLTFRTAFGSQWEHYMAPAIANGAVYTNGGTYGGLLSFRQSDGDTQWFANLYQYDEWTPAVDSRYAYAFMPNGLNAIHVADGSAAFVIGDPNNAVQPYSVRGAPMIVGANNVVVINGSPTGRLVNFDVGARQIKWSLVGSFRASPAFAKGVIYVINGAQLEARSESNGERLWAWLPDEASTDPFGQVYGSRPLNVVVTDNLVFVSTNTKVYAIDIATRKAVWTFAKPGSLALSPNGILYIATAYTDQLGPSLYAINLR